MVAELWPNDPLTQLANRYLSDKGTTYNCAHGYIRVYHAMLSPIREAPLRILEIGLIHGRVQTKTPQDIPRLGCPSLRMWADFLPNAEIHGIDIADFTSQSNNRFTVWQADQGSREELLRFTKVAGKFDLIIDDGSHASHHQQASWHVFSGILQRVELYAIEDLHFQPAEIEMPESPDARLSLWLGSLARHPICH